MLTTERSVIDPRLGGYKKANGVRIRIRERRL
jgi:hypothetical protein